MEAQVYHLGRGLKLVPVTASEDAIGQRVVQAYHGAAVITGKSMSGYTVTFDDGSQSDGQQFDCLSPYTRIVALEPAEYVSAEEVEWLRVLAAEFRANQIAATKAAEIKHAQDKEQFINELRAKYPKAKPGQPSANLRAELKAAFPKTKFSATKDGNSIRVKWTDGASEEAVDAICGKYPNGHFDGMDDCHHYDKSAYGRAVDAVLGRVDYVFATRHYSPQVMQDAVDVLTTRYGWSNEIKVLTSDYDGHAYREGSTYEQDREIYGLLNSTDLQF